MDYIFFFVRRLIVFHAAEQIIVLGNNRFQAVVYNLHQIMRGVKAVTGAMHFVERVGNLFRIFRDMFKVHLKLKRLPLIPGIHRVLELQIFSLKTVVCHIFYRFVLHLFKLFSQILRGRFHTQRNFSLHIIADNIRYQQPEG